MQLCYLLNPFFKTKENNWATYLVFEGIEILNSMISKFMDIRNDLKIRIASGYFLANNLSPII